MRLVRFALANPFAILALVLGLSFLGLSVYPKISTDLLPDFKQPVVVSYFSYPGLPTMDMEKSVTSRVERALTLAGKLERIESRTLPGAAVIKTYFQPGADSASAMNDIVNMQASDMFHLPPGIEWPFTMRSEPANTPVVLGAISGEGLSESQLYTIGYYAVRNKMGGLKGVQIPHPFGGKFRQIMVYVDPVKLESYQLSSLEVVSALEKSNLVMSAGTVKLGTLEYQLHPENTLQSLDDISNLPVAVRNNKTIFVKDVGYVKDDAAIQYNIVRVNGNRSVYVPLLREPGENTIDVVDRITEGLALEIPAMKQRGEIPEATTVELVSDQSTYIRQAIENLKIELLLGALLVVLVVFLFMREFRASLGVLFILPISLLIGMLGFFFTGHSINVMTLAGLALAVGTVVDVGIVVVENIIRHRDNGKPLKQAIHDATIEIANPVGAGTITTLVVFIPVIFLTGMLGYLFVPLSLAAVLAIAASYFVGVMVIPTLCGKILSKKSKGININTSEQSTDVSTKPATKFETKFESVLKRVLAHSKLTVAVIGLIIAFSFTLLPQLGQELFPQVDSGTFEIRIKTTPGSRLERTEGIVANMEETIKSIIGEKDLKAIISNIGMPVGKGAGFSTILSSNSGPDTAFIVVNLNNDERVVSTENYVQKVRKALDEKFPEEQLLIIGGGIINLALNEGTPTPIDIVISAGNLGLARTAAEEIVEKVSEIEGTSDVQIAQTLDYPQLDIKVDRTKAAQFGITQEDVAKNLSTAFGSSLGFTSLIWIDPKSGTDFFMGVQYANNEIESLDDIRNMPISVKNSKNPQTIPLQTIAEIKRVTIPGEISHRDISRVYNVYVNTHNRDLGSVTADVEKRLAELTLPAGVTVKVRGPAESMKQGMTDLGYGMVVAVVLIFLVLMAQFKSFTDPFVILLAVPAGFIGVIWTLFLTGTTINIQSLIGTLMLIGIVVNNSILIVDFANVLMREGKLNATQAVIQATRVRLRPILMTALVLVASMAPFTFQFTLGNEAMIPMARALVGGLMVSTFMTLFLVPCVFAMLKKQTVRG